MKTANTWHCDDCHKIGFYYDLTDEEIRDKHEKECEARIETLVPPTRWPEDAEL